jgi:ribosomal protein S27AE
MEGELPRPKAAKHGLLCNSCFYRLHHALKLIPDLMANMRALIEPGSAAALNERVQGGGDGSPAPLRIDPLDASDSLFAKLVSWTEVIGGELHTPQPSVAVWINFREVQGSRPVTPSTAHELASQLVEWFTVRLEDIAASTVAAAFHDDLVYGWEDARGVFSLAASYGVEPRPVRAADKRECPVCGHHEVFVKWPDKFDPDVAILCGRCKWVAEPEKYGHYARLFG